MSSAIDRRQFLSSSAIAGAAAGLALSASAARAAEAPGNKISVGVMGLSRGRSLAVSFAKTPGVEVKYVCDVDTTRAASAVDLVVGAGGNKPEAIADFRRILDDKSVDALVCAAPNHWHAPATILACSAGKHVYVEKPCSHNPREGELMVEAARKNNRAVQLGTQRRSGPGTREAMRKLHEGAIGRVYLSRAWYNSARGPIGPGTPADAPDYLNYELWQGPAPRTPYVENRIHYNWHWFWHWGNGELGNNGVHTLDLCRWGLGVDFPIRVASSGGRYVFDDEQETADTHTVCYEFDGKRQITWEGLSCNRHSAGFVNFYGDKGSLELESNGNHRVYDERDKLIDEYKTGTLGEPEHVANFVDAIRSGDWKSLNAEIAEGHKSTLLCHLGNISHRTGRTLNCDPANGHIQDDPQAMALWQRDYQPGWEPKV